MSKRLQDRVVMVTGAGRGFGWGVARAFGLAGARVCATDVNTTELARCAADLQADGGEALTLPLDVSDLSAFQATVAQVIARWGRLDALVHCAIVMPLVSFAETTPELWQRELQVSIGGLCNGTRAVWDVMKAQGGGHIIGIASGSSVRGYKNEVIYCAGKHAQEGFVKALALEAAAERIAINTIGPGKPIKPTRMTWAEYDQLPIEQKAAWADPVALGQAFVWLASQLPDRFSGYRFDAGPIVDTIAREGFDFAFAPEKTTLYVDDFVARQQWYASYPT